MRAADGACHEDGIAHLLVAETGSWGFYDCGRVAAASTSLACAEFSSRTQVPQWPSVQLGCCPTSLYLVGSFCRLHRVVGDWLRGLWWPPVISANLRRPTRASAGMYLGWVVS